MGGDIVEVLRNRRVALFDAASGVRSRSFIAKALVGAPEELDQALTEIETLRARVGELEGETCPRPCNNRPDDFTIGQCNDAGECGCVFGRAALATKGEKE